MNAANQRRLTPALIALATVLGAMLLLLLSGIGRGAHWSAPRALAPLPPASNPADLPRPLPLEQFAAVWQKPLFSPDRKPIAHAADGGNGLGDLELTGIILTSGLRMALLRDKNGDREVRLHEGESLPDGSVTLVEVRDRSALFDSSAGRTELKLPAGAPLDEPRVADAGGRSEQVGAMMQVVPAGAGAQTSDGRSDDRSGNGNVIVAPTQPPADAPSVQPPSTTPFLERLRENAQKRRAEHAAATHEGVR